MPTQLNGVKKVVVVDDGTNEKFVALGKWTATDSASSVIQTSTDATTWTKMNYVSDPYGGAFRDDLITQEFDGLTFGEHTPPGTFYTDIGLPARSFRLPGLALPTQPEPNALPTAAEYPDARWKKFHNYTTGSTSVLVALTSNLSDDAGFAYSAISTSKGLAWATGTLVVPSQLAEDEEWVDIVSVFISGTKTFVAMTNYGQIATSTTGYTWTYGVIDKTLLTGERIQAIAVYSTTPTDDGTVYAVSNRNAYRSTNLTAWTKDSSTSWADYPVSDVVVDNGYIMIGSSAAGSTLMRYKYHNGGTWTVSSPLGTAYNVSQIVPFGTRYIIFTDGDYFLSAVKQTSPSTTNAPFTTISASNFAGNMSWFEPVSIAFAWNDLATPVLYALINKVRGSEQHIEMWKMTQANYSSFTLANQIAIPDSGNQAIINRKAQFGSGTYLNAFTTTGISGAISGTDRLELVDGYGNSYYKTYTGSTTNANSAFTSDYTDVEFQALAESLVQSSPNSTRYQQYLGFFGAGNRFPVGSAWDMMANDAYRKIALNIGTATTARSDNYEVMLAAGTMNNARSWKDITFGANKYVVIAQNGFEWSINGTTWNECIRPGDASTYVWRTITYMPSNGISSGRFYTIAENSNRAMSSTDGITWTYTANLPASANYRSSDSSSDLSVFLKADANTCVVSNHSVPVAYTTQTLPSSKPWTDVIHGYHYSTHTGSGDNATQYTSPTLTPSLVDGYVKHSITKSYMTVNGVRTGVSITPVSLQAHTAVTNMFYSKNGVFYGTFGQADVEKVSPGDHWGDWSRNNQTFKFKFRAESYGYSSEAEFGINLEQEPAGLANFFSATAGTGDYVGYSQNWQVGDRWLLRGSKYGGVDGVNDLIITVTQLEYTFGNIFRLTVAPAPGNTGYLNLPGGRYATGASLTAVRNTTTGVYTRTLVGGSGFQVGDELSTWTNNTLAFFPVPRPRDLYDTIIATVTSVNGSGGITGLKYIQSSKRSRYPESNPNYFTLPSTQAPALNVFRLRTISNVSSTANTPADMTSRLEYDNGNPDLTVNDSTYILARTGDVYIMSGSYFDGITYSITWGTGEIYDTNVSYYTIPRGPSTAEIQVRMTPGNSTPTLILISGGSSYPSSCTASINGSYCGGTSSQNIEFTITTGDYGTITGISSVSGTITPPTVPTFTVGKLGTAYNNISMVSSGTGITPNTQFKFLGSVFNGVNSTNDIILNAATTNLTRITNSNLDGRVLTFSTISGTASWTPATFQIVRNKKVNSIYVTNGGLGHIVGNAVKIDGSDYGGNSSNDITITPTAVSSVGAITAFTSSYTGYEGRFVAIGSGPGNAYSNDGFTWTTTTLPNQDWTTIAYTKNSYIYVPATAQSQTGLFVATTATNSVIAISIDGITWTQKALPKSSTWKQIAFFKDRFILLDGSRYPLISNKINSLVADPANITLTWSDYGEEYLSYWTSTEMTDIVYIGGKYIGVGKGTLPDGTIVPLVWKATTLSGAKATWRLYGTASDLGQLSNIINVGGDFAFISEAVAYAPSNNVLKFTTTFINDATTTGYKIPENQTTSFPGGDTVGYARIESNGTKFYLTHKDDSISTFNIS